MKERNKPMSPSENQPGGGAQLSQKEAELDQTRSAIKEDLQTLGQRLSPDHLKQDAKEVMSEAKNKAVETLHEAKEVATSTFRDVKNDAVETVSATVNEFKQDVRRAEQETLGFLRQNAVPLALLGIGAYWLFSNTSRSRRDEQWEGRYRPYDDYPPRDESHGRGMREHGGGMRESAQQTFERASGSAREAGQQASRRAQDWAESAQHRASDIAGRMRQGAENELGNVQHAMRQTGQRVSDAASRARDYAGRELRDARDYSMRVTESHPLAVGAAALTAGIGLGLLLPQTRRESEMLGTRRDRLIGEAKEAVQEWGQAAKEAARDVKDTISGATHH